jgi:large subunit ribosomal protein L22
MKAALNDYRQSPRKVRLVADLMRGKSTSEALRVLTFTTKRATLPIKKLLESAIANAKNGGASTDNLFVKEIQVNQGVTLKRIMPRAMGSASRINKRSSHVTIILGDKSVTAPAKEVKTAKTEKTVKAPKAEKPVKKAKKTTK